MTNYNKTFMPEFIPFYPKIKEKHNLTTLETLLYGFIKFYLNHASQEFYFSNEQLAEMFRVAKRTISSSIGCLADKKLIKITLHAKPTGGTFRSIRVAENCYADTQKIASRYPSSKKLLPNNNILKHNTKNNNNKNNMYNGISEAQLLDWTDGVTEDDGLPKPL